MFLNDSTICNITKLARFHLMGCRLLTRKNWIHLFYLSSYANRCVLVATGILDIFIDCLVYQVGIVELTALPCVDISVASHHWSQIKRYVVQTNWSVKHCINCWWLLLIFHQLQNHRESRCNGLMHTFMIQIVIRKDYCVWINGQRKYSIPSPIITY